MQVGMELQCIPALTVEQTKTGGNTTEPPLFLLTEHRSHFTVASSICWRKMQDDFFPRKSSTILAHGKDITAQQHDGWKNDFDKRDF